MATFVIAPGDVLLAADTTGGGHRWELIDDQPWTRIYVELAGSRRAGRRTGAQMVSG